jgi:long-chain acyl-CoA synthetase
VREYSAPAGRPVADDENMSDVVWANAERFSDVVSFRRQVDGTWLDVTAKEFAAQVLAVAKGLVKAGIGRGDRVGLMSKTRYEWTLIDFAIWAAGAVTVPIYETSAPEQVYWILSDSAAKAVFVETDEHLGALDKVRDRLPELAHIWQTRPPPRSWPRSAPSFPTTSCTRGAVPSRRTTSPPSSTPPARPGGPRASS